MRLIICDGLVNREPEFDETAANGGKLRFNVAAEGEGRDGPLWMRCTVQGKRAVQLAHHLEQGDIVTVKGKPRCVSEGAGDGSPPLYVEVSEVVIHAELPPTPTEGSADQ